MPAWFWIVVGLASLWSIGRWLRTTDAFAAGQLYARLRGAPDPLAAAIRERELASDAHEALSRQRDEIERLRQHAWDEREWVAAAECERQLKEADAAYWAARRREKLADLVVARFGGEPKLDTGPRNL